MKKAKNAVDAAIHGISGKPSSWNPFGGVRDTLTRAAVTGGAIYGGKEGSQADAMDRDVRQKLGLQEKDWFGRNKGAIAGTAAGFAGGLAGRAIARHTGMTLGGLGTLVGVGVGSKIAGGMANKYIADQNRKERDREIELMKLKNQSNFTDMYQTRQFNKLTDFVKNHQNALIGAGVGAGAGVAGGYLMDRKAKRKGNWFQKNAGAIIGGVGGAGLGYAAGEYGPGLYKRAFEPKHAGPKYGGVGSSFVSGDKRFTVTGRNDDASGIAVTHKIEQLRGVNGGKLADPRTVTVTQGGLPTASAGSLQRGLDTDSFMKANRAKQAAQLAEARRKGFKIEESKAGFGGKKIFKLWNPLTDERTTLASDYLDHIATKYYAGTESVAAATMNTTKTEGKQAQGLWNRIKSGASTAGNFAKTNWKGAAIGAVGLGAAGAGIGGIVASRRRKNKKKAMAIGAGIGAVAGAGLGMAAQHYGLHNKVAGWFR
jgi:hypothetical protein